MTGLVSEITTFSTRDGPGIRTTVFLKGCPLRCKWCSNPETFKPYAQLYYISSKCKGCGKCEAVCPQGAISEHYTRYNRVDRSKCDLCMKCVNTCLNKAFKKSGETYTVERLMGLVERDRPFFGATGGLTVSGGEPLLQGEFVKALFRQCKARGISTVLDTSGYGDNELLQELLEDTDLALLDIKHMDPESHLKWTGRSNALILKNATLIARTVKTRISIPLIAGVNDSPENIHATARFAVEHGIEWIDVNPFHKLGAGKYHYLGMRSPYNRFLPLEKETIQSTITILQQYGLQTTLGRMM